MTKQYHEELVRSGATMGNNGYPLKEQWCDDCFQFTLHEIIPHYLRRSGRTLRQLNAPRGSSAFRKSHTSLGKYSHCQQCGHSSFYQTKKWLKWKKAGVGKTLFPKVHK